MLLMPALPNNKKTGNIFSSGTAITAETKSEATIQEMGQTL
jgi:hypothetical protein